jgi:hypothetical protein
MLRRRLVFCIDAVPGAIELIVMGTSDWTGSGAVHAQIASVHDQISLLGGEPLGDSQIVLRKMLMTGGQMCIGYLDDTHGKPPRQMVAKQVK